MTTAELERAIVGDRAARLAWVLGPAPAVPTLDHDAGFDTILDQLGELGLWEGAR